LIPRNTVGIEPVKYGKGVALNLTRGVKKNPRRAIATIRRTLRYNYRQDLINAVVRRTCVKSL
ncbi:unnamed protein product, partial [Candidula unifasciata]